MLDNLKDKFLEVFKNARGMGKLTDENMEKILKEIRLALLEADVNFLVAKRFVQNIKSEFRGSEVQKSFNPSMQVVKIVKEQLTKLLGEKGFNFELSQNSQNSIMIVGLQGSGKTTTCAKLANFFRKKRFSSILCACDVYRPAAVEQLKTLGKQLAIDVVSKDTKKVKKIAKLALSTATKEKKNITIFDTAGRLQIDSKMMSELVELKAVIKPKYIFFVADSMTGQDAVNSASGFDESLDIDGIILTKMDSDTRGGAALSMMAITGKPIVFSGVGESVSDIEQFFPDRVAQRILGMGDMLTLIEKAEQTISAADAEKMTKRLIKAQFTFTDFLKQLTQIQKMGSISSILKMIPGLNSQMVQNANIDKVQIRRLEAMILSMTPFERDNPSVINGQRRKRIAGGSGTTPQMLNQLISRFNQMKKMMKNLSNPNFARSLTNKSNFGL